MLPGLSYDVAYVRGDDIKTSATRNGHEHKFFNQIQYKVQDGLAKDLRLKLRYSMLRVSSDAADYNIGVMRSASTLNILSLCSE